MWLEFVYQPTALFSLKSSDATNSAAKSLLIPSPYSVKMALLNAICTFESIETANEYFELIRDMEIQFALPKYVAVNNCFIKIIKKDDHPKTPEDLFKSTVAFREFVYFSGELKLAVRLSNESYEDQTDFLKCYFSKVNYFGKRASFFQLVHMPKEPILDLPKEYSREINDKTFGDGRAKILMKVDDFGEDVDFENVSTFSGKRTKRMTRIIFLPLKMIKSNKNFTVFARTEPNAKT